jgi:hypothetical protein
MTPQAIRAPEFPTGRDFGSGGSAWATTARLRIPFFPRERNSGDRHRQARVTCGFHDQTAKIAAMPQRQSSRTVERRRAMAGSRQEHYKPLMITGGEENWNAIADPAASVTDWRGR